MLAESITFLTSCTRLSVKMGENFEHAMMQLQLRRRATKGEGRRATKGGVDAEANDYECNAMKQQCIKC